jgi:hypothetical protein
MKAKVTTNYNVILKIQGVPRSFKICMSKCSSYTLGHFSINLILQMTNLISRSASYLWTLEHDVDLPLGQAPLL